ncbi:hypothetical protein IWZ03DRAFT_413950 [Phyllosticta citriasiana]|uniref:Uncharacterized protein n=1 Tax=Phyllosticta citriasiana TaxID=595635 RepID=A0ABR1KUQ5_9PEZI
MGQPKSNNLTPRDLEIAAAAWKCFKTEPSIDYAKLAEVAGFKNAASASACWNTTKKKLFASSTASNDIASPGTPKTPASRKRKATPAKKSTGEDVFEGTPSKKGKKNIEIEDDEVIDNTDVKNEVKEEEEEIEEFLDTDRKDSFFDTTVAASTTVATSTTAAASTTIVATPVSTTSTSSSISSSLSSLSSVVTSSALVTPSSISSSLSSTSSTGPQTLTVQAGANGFNFSPNVTYANPGDTVIFDFYPTNHSVIRGEYANNTKVCGLAGCNPCVPWELYHEGEPNKGFFSSNELVSSYNMRKQWSLIINDTEPIFFYCDALTSCHPEGMVGVINPARNQSIEFQQQKAVKAEYQLAPGQSWPAEGSKSSNSSSSSSSSSHKGGMHLSGGSIAGIVIGVVTFVTVAGALIFYVARTRTYDKVFRQSQIGGSEAGGGVGPSGDGAAASLSWYKSPSIRVASPPPGDISNNGATSPQLASEKSPNPYRWSDITAMSGAVGGAAAAGGMHQRHSTAPPGEGSTFVGYNRQTGAPEFAPELPGDSEIQQLPGGETPPMGSTRSPAEMEATSATPPPPSAPAPPPPPPMSPTSTRPSSSSVMKEPASPATASNTGTRRGSSQSSPGKKHFGFPGRTY